MGALSGEPSVDPARTKPDLQERDRGEFVRRLLIAVLTVSAVALIIILFWHTVQVLLLIFAGIILAVFLRGMSNWVRRKTGLPDLAALAIVIMALIFAIGLALWLLTPHVLDQADQLMGQIPNAIQRMRDLLLRNEVAKRIVSRLPQPEEILSSTEGLMGRAAGVFSSTLGAIGSFVAVLFIGFYFAFDPRIYTEGFLRIVPPGRRERASEVIRNAAYTLHWWLLGRLLDMAVVAAVTIIGLWLLGIKLALTLGLLAGFLTFVPYLGPIVSAIPAVLIAMLDSLTLGFYVILLYLGIQMVESYLITPAIQQRTVSVPPVLLISVQILMGILFGIPGVVLATPAMALFLALVRMIYIEDILGEKANSKENDRSRVSAEENI